MKTIIIILSVALFCLSSLACDCKWGGDFFTISNESDLVVKVRVINKIKGSSGFNTKMEVEVLECFKGDETRKVITILGDNGAECRPYIDYFNLGDTYYLSLYNFGDEYEQMNCGEMYLKLHDSRVINEMGVRKDLPQVGEMSSKAFEIKLKENLL
ncbi:MAG: hypothetical protein ACPGSD_04820 [Flavobacteriales bacterium]